MFLCCFTFTKVAHGKPKVKKNGMRRRIAKHDIAAVYNMMVFLWEYDGGQVVSNNPKVTKFFIFNMY